MLPTPTHPVIVDKVVVPKGLTPGDYVLSYRFVGWDKINIT